MIFVIEDTGNTEATEARVSFGKGEITTMTWLTTMAYLCHNENRYVPLIVSTSRSFTHSRLIIGFVTIFTRRVPLMHHDLQTLLEHLSSPGL